MLKKFNNLSNFEKLVIVGILFFLLYLPAGKQSQIKQAPTTTATPKPARFVFNDRKLWGLIQEWRGSQNLSIYIEDQRLCAIAKDRANDLATLNRQDDHEEFLRKYSNYPFVISENTDGTDNNISIPDIGEKIMLDAWLNSKSHREALLKNYRYSCLSCEKAWCSQIFSNF